MISFENVDRWVIKLGYLEMAGRANAGIQESIGKKEYNAKK